MGFFYEQGYGNSLAEEGMDLCFMGTNRLLVGWQENAGGLKEMAVWNVLENNHLDYTFTKPDPNEEWERVATGVIEDGTDYYVISVVTDAYTGKVRAGDLLFLTAFDATGVELWEVNYPIEGIMPKDILFDPQNNNSLVVIADRYKVGGGVRGLELLSFDTQGNINWVTTYTGHGVENVSTTELVIDAKGYTTIANNETFGPEPIMWTNNGVYINHSNPLNTEFRVFGIEMNAGESTIYAAGETGPIGGQDAAIIRFPFDQNTTSYQYGLHWQYDHHSTDESFHDLVLHNQGVSACGWVDASDVGRSLDGLGVNFDYSGDIQIDQAPIGGEGQEYLNVILNQSDEYAYLVGYNEVHTVAGSGNNWHMGFVNYSSQSASTTLPRFMYVDFILDPKGSQSADGCGASNGWGRNFSTDQEARDIINNAKNNNISIIFLTDVDQLFQYGPNAGQHGNSYNPPHGNYDAMLARVQVLIDEAEQNNIDVGWVTGPDRDKIDFIKNQVRLFNYSHPQNLRYAVLEHEFWLPWTEDNKYSLDGTQNPQDKHCPTGIACPHSQSTRNSNWDAYSLKLRDDHITLLQKLWNLKMQDCNFWKNATYIGYTWILTNSDLSYPYTNSAYGAGNSIFRSNTAELIMQNTDMVFLPYYQIPNWSNGVDFDWNNTPTSNGWEGRFEDFNQHGLSFSTKFAPLFNAQDRVNQPCTARNYKPFMGNWLDNSGSLVKAEDIWLNGDAALNLNGYTDYFNNPNTSHDIEDIPISAFVWYSYTFLEEISYLSTNTDGLNNIPTTGNYFPGFLRSQIDLEVVPVAMDNVLKKQREIENISIELYPNPVINEINIISENIIDIISIIDLNGKVIHEVKMNVDKLDVSFLKKGLYFLRTTSGKETTMYKFVKF
jgi:hypothetical protein